MKPTVGRIVYYTNLGDSEGRFPPEQQAAIITKVEPVPNELAHGHKHQCDETCWWVSLHIFYETGNFLMTRVPFSEKFERGCWSWPPKV